MFILVQTYQRESRRPAESRSEHIGRVVGQVVPTILLASCSEVACFFLGMEDNLRKLDSFICSFYLYVLNIAVISIRYWWICL